MVEPVIEVNDDGTASGRWYVWDPAIININNDAAPTWVAGVYDDVYRRIEGSRYFAHVRLTLSLLARYESGWGERRVQS